jgi:predicted Zn-dependent protease
MRRGHFLAALVAVALALIGYYSTRVQNPITGETQHIAITQDQEIALGLQSAPEMAAQFGGLDPDPVLQEMVQRVGTRIVENSIAGRTGYRFQFALLHDAETVNAFALPGGPVFVTRGLVAHLGHEAELAGVIGHEIGHVIARHSAAQIARSQLAQGLIGAAGIAGSDGANGGQNTARLAAFAAEMAQLRYGRRDEIQADTLGVKLMSEAGYDPRAMLALMSILERAGGGSRQPEFLSSHPDPGNRSARIQAAIASHFPHGVPAQLTEGDPIQN